MDKRNVRSWYFSYFSLLFWLINPRNPFKSVLTITTNNHNINEWAIQRSILKLKISFASLYYDEKHRLKSLSQHTSYSFAFILKNKFQSAKRCQFIHVVFVFDVNDKYWTILHVRITIISQCVFPKCVQYKFYVDIDNGKS